MSNEFVDAFAENLRLNVKLNSLILNKTQLSDSALEQILKNVSIDLTKLEISYNEGLTVKSYKIIKQMISDNQR